MEGWISLHRKILENPILNRSRVYSNFEAWIWLLLKANHKDNKFMLGSELIKVKKGSMITSQKKLCRQFRWGSTKLRNFLKVLQKDKMLLLETNTQSTHITICNYDSYQDKQTSNKKQTTHAQRTDNTRTTTNNNVNKDNNVNNITLQDFQDLLINQEYLEKYGYAMLNEFVEYWIEPTINCKKYRWQMQKAFKMSKRLSTWASQDYKDTFKRHKEKMIQKEQDEYLKNASKNAHKTPEYQNEEIKKMISGIGKKV